MGQKYDELDELKPYEEIKVLEDKYHEILVEILKTPEMADKRIVYHDGVLADDEVRISPGSLGIEVISYRGSIKSTIFQALVSWQVQRKYIDIAVGTYSLGQLEKEWIPNFRIMLELAKENMKLEWWYKTDNVDKKIIEWIDPKSGKKKIGRLQGVGHRGAIRMIHPDEWIIDDWLDKKMESTLEEAERVFAQEIVGTRVTGGRICIIGTILAEGDLLYKIRKGEVGGNFFNFSGIYFCYFEGTETPRWKKRGRAYLKDQLDIQGEIIFQIEYMLNPMSDKQALVKSRFIDAAKDKDLCLTRKPHTDAYIVAGCDFQFSDASSSDWGVTFSLEVWLDDEVRPSIRVIAMDRYQGRDEDEIIKGIRGEYDALEHDLIAFETNHFQRILANMWKKRNITIPIYEHTTGNERNVTQIGIPSLSQYFTDFDIAIPWDCEDCRTKMGIFLGELQGWQYSVTKRRYISKSRYKDTTMAFWLGTLAVKRIETGTLSVSEIVL